MATIPPFPAGTVEAVAKIIGDLYSGSELTRLASEVPLRDDPGEGNTKWRRLAHALSSHQARSQSGNALGKLTTVAMRPDRTLDRKRAADVARDDMNQALSIVGLRVLDDGRVATAKVARTDAEALARTKRLRSMLEQRAAHAQVLAYCREELLLNEYYEAVFEAIKGLGARLREIAGVDADGHALVDQTLAGQAPTIQINTGSTRTERDEQLGVANLAKGLFSAFRNPAAHEPRLQWNLTELDALEVLGTLSLIHRRLDQAVVRA